MKILFLILLLSVNTQASVFKELIEVDQIEAVASGHCQIRQATKILKDGQEISKTYHRWSVEPGGDLSLFDDRVKAICKAAWTPEVIKKFKAQKKLNESRLSK